MGKPTPQRFALFLAVVSLFLFPSSPSPGGTTYFPLEEGDFWVYEDARFGSPIERRVVERSGDIVQLDYGNGPVLTLRDRVTEIDIALPSPDTADRDEFGLFYRFEPGSSWVHHDPFECDNRVQVHVVPQEEPVETPAGSFTDCLRIEFASESPCADAGTRGQWWAPGVGLVKWEETSFAGARTYLLVEFGQQPGGPGGFLRGDTDSSGERSISDAIVLLSHLFAGGDKPPCKKAADSNDDGNLDVADAIYLLGFLFLGSPAPPAPFEECGDDLTPDELDCETYPACE